MLPPARAPTVELFDAHLHADRLSDQDLESMRFFGVTGAVVPAHSPSTDRSAQGLLLHFRELLDVHLPRLARAGIRGYVTLGVHPGAIPRRGVTEVLQALPSFFGTGQVVALGEIGLERGGRIEEEVFEEQLELARRLKLRVLVHTPVREKETHTRRLLALLRSSGLPPGRVLVDHASPRTVRLILECGYFAGLTIHPDQVTAEQAVVLVRRLGGERLVLDTDAGTGATDIVGLARVASLLGRAGLSPELVEGVCRDNARGFFLR